MAQRLGAHSVHSAEALRLYREILRTLRRFDDRATRIYYYNYARTVREAAYLPHTSKPKI